MSGQEIKIPVSANTKGAERAADDLANAFGDVAAAVGAIGTASRQADRGFADLVRRARETRRILSRELGAPISAGDTTTFMRNFAGMQPRSSSLRGFRSELDWFSGHSTLFADERRAAEHRRRVLTYGMQGTAFAQGNPGMASPVAGGGGGGGGRGGGGGSPFAGGLARTGSMGMKFGASLLALAGITSIAGMAGRAKDLATEEAVGLDALKRRMGDLGIAFNELRDRARGAGDGLGITYVESQRLAASYTREVGNLGKADLAGLGGNLRTQFGFARAYGADPAASTQFFGQMARYGVGRDESGARRLAMLIGDSVARSGYGGKVEDLLQAVADYTATASRTTLTVANSTAYANALTSLSSRGIPGLDPQAAASLLGTADSAIRRGGAMGEASLNFSYAALRNASPGMNPVQAMALMEGGLFGTSRGVFGGSSPLRKFMGAGIRLDDTTNFEKMIPLLRRSYGNGGYFLDAVKNHFGLQSHAQAAALADMSDRGVLGATGRALSSAGVDPMRLNASGFQMIGTLANARGSGLQSAFSDIVNRKDVSAAQRRTLLAAAASAQGGGEDAVRRAMVSAVASLNIAQEKTVGTETRDAITDLTDKLTEAGGPLLSVLNPIREAVVSIAERFVPGFMDVSGTRPVGSAPWQDGNLGVGRGNKKRAPLEAEAMRFFESKGWSHVQAAGIVGNLIAESNLDPMASNKIKGGHRGIAQWDAGRWRRLVKFAAERGASPDDRTTQLAFVDWELRNTHSGAGNFLAAATTPFGAAAAFMDFEKPRGYYTGVDPRKVEGWRSRYGQTARLASDEKAPAAAGATGNGAHVTGEATVVIKDERSGRSHTVAVPMSSAAGKARPAGAVGGRAPLIAGHYSTPPAMAGR